MGLQTRIKTARLLVWLDDPARLDDVVRIADVVVSHEPLPQADPALIRAAMAPATTDLVLGCGRGRAEPGHEFGLVGHIVTTKRELSRALQDDAVDAVVCSLDLVERAVRIADPTSPDSTPWFADVISLDEGRQAVQAGAVRLAGRPASREEAAAMRKLVSDVWRHQMADVTFAAMRS